VLIQPDFKKEFILETDASDYGIGAILGQKDQRGDLRPISFISRKLTSAERNYSTREKEALGCETLSILMGLKVYDHHRPQVLNMDADSATRQRPDKPLGAETSAV